MFWGLVLEPGKRYSTTVEKSFHVSKAVLDCSSIRNDGEILNVMLETEGSESILCNLCKQKGLLQESLDLNFLTGDRLTFECRGNGRVHLSGYLLNDDDDEVSGMMDDESEEDEDEEESEVSPEFSSKNMKKEKRKLDAPPDNPSKKKKITTTDDDDEDDDDEDDMFGSDAGGSDLSEDMDDEDLDDEEDDDEGEEEGSEEDDEDSPNLKQNKKDKNKTPNKHNQPTPNKKTPVTNGMTPKEQKSNKKTPGGSTVASPNSTPKQKQVLEQGVVIKDLKVGTGQPVKSGKFVAVRYLGKFKEGGKVFDKSMKGDTFKFKLGKGEVIKGWDIGMQGMKVGGKRIIHCPPQVAYGAKGAPPKIPPNSSLVFEVEVVNVN